MAECWIKNQEGPVTGLALLLTPGRVPHTRALVSQPESGAPHSSDVYDSHKCLGKAC